MANSQELLSPLRTSLVIEIHQHQERDVLLVHDVEGYAEQDIMLDASLLPLLNALDGQHTLQSLHEHLNNGQDDIFDLQSLQHLSVRLTRRVCLSQNSSLTKKSL